MTDDAWFGVTPEPVAMLVSPPFISIALTHLTSVMLHRTFAALLRPLNQS